MYKFSAELSLLRISCFYSSGCPLALNLALLHPALQRVLVSRVAGRAEPPCLLGAPQLLSYWVVLTGGHFSAAFEVYTDMVPSSDCLLPTGVAHCCTASVSGLSLHRGLLKVVLAPV